jgi:hypothetical protein
LDENERRVDIEDIVLGNKEEYTGLFSKKIVSRSQAKSK